MKIVQSYWSLPSRREEEKDGHGRFKGGWLSEKYHYMSIALSCLRLKQYYSDVQLVTDDYGKHILIDVLKLPYTSVELTLNQLENYPHGLWALPKICAYQQQEEAFLHVDNDVYIWEPFAPSFINAPLAVQNLETNAPVYRDGLQYLLKEFTAIPAYFDPTDSEGSEYDDLGSRVVAINAGVFGGTDTAFIRSYCEEVLSFIHQNMDVIVAGGKGGMLNVIFEQYIFYKLAAQQGREIASLIEQVGPGFYRELWDIDKVPFMRKYIHLLSTAKRSPSNCEQVEFRLRHEFPEYYQRLVDYLATLDGYEDEPFEQLIKPYLVPSIELVEKYIRPAVSPAFERTSRFLQQLFPEAELGCRVQLESHITQAQARLTTDQQALLSSLFQLESLGNDLLAGHFDQERKFRNVCRAYEVMGSHGIDGLLEQPLLASNHIRVLTSHFTLQQLNQASPVGVPAAPLANRLFLLVERLPDGLMEQELDAWPKMLYYFQDEPLTGRELMEGLCANTSVLAASSREEFHEGVVEFLTLNLVFDSYLTFN
jgi:hypothetical protein